MILDLEKRRLEDLDGSRKTAFKYAIPSALVNGVAGSLATLLTRNIFILAFAAVFAGLIFYLAWTLDQRKDAERYTIMYETDVSMLEIREQEAELLLRSG